MAEVVESEEGRVGQSKRVRRRAVKQRTREGEEGTMTELEVSTIEKIKYFIEVEAVVLEGVRMLVVYSELKLVIIIAAYDLTDSRD